MSTTQTSITSNIISLEDYREQNTLTPSAITQWKDRINEDLSIIIEEWRNEIEIAENLINSVKSFIDDLPYDIEPPSISIENQNSILFEWSKEIDKERIGAFSAIVEETRIVFSTYNLNTRNDGPKGVLNMSSSSVALISNIILEHFKANISHAQRNRQII